MMLAKFSSPYRRGFSVFDVLLLLLLLPLLLGLLPIFPYMIRQSSQRLNSQDNLKEMVLAMHSANDAHKKLPPSYGWYPISENRNSGWSRPAGYGTVFYHILPFLEYDNVYNNTQGNSSNSFGTVVRPYVSSTDPTLPPKKRHHHNRGAISYAANGFALTQERLLFGNSYNSLGFMGDVRTGSRNSQTSLPKITAMDGIANTVAFAERYATCWSPLIDASGQEQGWRKFERVWGEATQNFNNFSPVIRRPLQTGNGDGSNRPLPTVPPELLPQFGADLYSCEPGTWQALDGRRIQVVMFDGAVRGIRQGITLSTWSCALRPDDGRRLGPDW